MIIDRLRPKPQAVSQDGARDSMRAAGNPIARADTIETCEQGSSRWDETRAKAALDRNNLGPGR